MFKKVGMKISFLVVMVLLMSTIGMGISSAEFSSPFREVDARSSDEAPFVARVSGTNVDFDWLAMVAANSYTMAVALTDGNGDVDMSSLVFLDMGSQKRFSTFDLPSGMIFYAAILADTDQGKVVSNTVEFMPFAGTVTFPTTGTVLMQLDDPGGIGTITVSGNINGDTVKISQISGDAGFGTFVLTVVDDKPASYTKGDLTMNFTYTADGTVMVQSVRNSVRSEDNLSDCQQTLLNKITDLIVRYNKDSYALLQFVDFFYPIIKARGRGNIALSNKLGNLAQFFLDAYLGVREKFEEDSATLTEEYDACIDNPAPDPDPTPVIPVITIDTSCSIPPGAVFGEFHYNDGSCLQYYILNGHYVGPYRHWAVKENGSLFLDWQLCHDIDGQNNGWQIWYYENGKMKTAVSYEHGIRTGHQYDFYEGGQLHTNITIVNDIETYWLIYNEDGSLSSYCDCAGDGIWH